MSRATINAHQVKWVSYACEAAIAKPNCSRVRIENSEIVDTEAYRDKEYSHEPPLWCLLVFSHQLKMDISVLVLGELHSLPKLLTVVERDVDNDGSQ